MAQLRGLLEAHEHLDETDRQVRRLDMRAAFWASPDEFQRLARRLPDDSPVNGDITNL